MSILIKNGTIVTSVNEYKADVLIEGEKIAAIGTGLEGRADQVVDASGKYVFPGGVDEHLHYNSFSSLGYETSDAAAVGGTTTVGDFVVQPKGIGLKDSIIKYKKEAVEGKAMVDYVLHGIIMDPTDQSFNDIPFMPEVGVASVKLFMAYKGMDYYATDDSIFKALQIAKKCGVTIMVHAENADIIDVKVKQLLAAGKTGTENFSLSRPILCEAEATSMAVYMAKMANAPLFVVHVTNRAAAEVLREARAEGVQAFGETCTHYLSLNDKNLEKPNFEGAKYVCNPPLRPQDDVDYLWEAIRNGWILAVSSDHCAVIGGFAIAKHRGINDFSKIPPGAPGVQDRLHMIWTYGVEKGKISRTQFVDVCCTKPAKICGIYPQKGEIDVGSDADIVIFDPDYKGVFSNETSLHDTDYNAFEGFEQIGRAEKVFSRGNLVAENGKFLGKEGQGQQVMAKPYGLCYDGFRE
jgi:dihydropyrimidinase